MKIFGVSQSSGVERRPFTSRCVPEGIVLIIKDHDGSKERERILMKVDDLLPAIKDPPPGGCGVEGISPIRGSKMQLRVEGPPERGVAQDYPGEGTGEGTDVAVGLDDFQDALKRGQSTARERSISLPTRAMRSHGDSKTA